MSFIASAGRNKQDTLTLELYMSYDTILTDLGSEVTLHFGEVYNFQKIDRKHADYVLTYSCESIEDTLLKLLEVYNISDYSEHSYYTSEFMDGIRVGSRMMKSVIFYLPKTFKPIDVHSRLLGKMPKYALEKFHSSLKIAPVDEVKISNSLKESLRDSIYNLHTYYSEKSVDTILNITVVSINFSSGIRNPLSFEDRARTLYIDKRPKRCVLSVMYGMQYILKEE
ncbi:hypothetical protein [Lishizhenia sp.]|uniref:hypothetical protein n=1 Tax=Lishizhenia sp. TaxID=2497594 RepID=UPI00299E71C9|nr:hypothetical protein [Lishizhenia sp.]MDX1447259.1 hypothetical protein [Lishizhenia sp.]